MNATHVGEPSMIGRSLGHYCVEEKLGAGGMGVVYRATDSILGRQVAIKILPDALAKDPGHLTRFEREARMLASLNHPNIAAIHGLEQSDGIHYLVLELVPGKTLAEQLSSEPPSVEEALEICRHIAEALEAAHGKGILHRDLKPSNIKVTPEGKVKVLDFGLAKAFEAAPSDVDVSESPTATAQATLEGAVFGTAAYMSPEQARGKTLDKRTDIWSFGCVLYEALSRRQAFSGETISDLIAGVLGQEPHWEHLPQGTPSNVRAVLRRCLQKDPQRRFRDIGDVRLELEEPEAVPTASVTPVSRRSKWQYAAYAMICLLAGAAITAGLAWKLLRKPQTPPQVVRFAIRPGPNEALVPGNLPSIAFSPDGTSLAYMVVRGERKQVYLRRIADLEGKPITGTEGALGVPVFSPDGQWLAFWQASKWKKVPLAGGPPVTMFDSPLGGAQMAAWGPDNTLVFGVYPAGMGRISAAGGQLQNVPILDPQKNERWGGSPQWLPGGKAVLFTMRTADVDSFNDYRTAVYSFQTGQRKILNFEGGVKGTYLSPGYLVHVRGGTFFAAPFDLSRLEATGTPVPVLDGVYQHAVMGGAKFVVSANGSLAYAPGGEITGAREVVWVDRQGKEQPLPLPPRAYLHPRISPDGLQLAIEVEGPNHDVFTYDLTRGTLTKLTFDGSSHAPLWTPDGRRLTFRVGMPDPFTMWAMPADRSGPKERLTTIGSQQSPASWSPDGRMVAFTQVDPETKGDIYAVAMDAERKPRAFARTGFNEGSPRFSPDGRWIAYCSNESGRNEVYVQEYPGPGPKIQISTEGGTDPVWKPRGGELYYRNGEKMMMVAVGIKPTFSAGSPGLLWEGRYNEGQNSLCGPPGAGSSNYDVASDGRHFLMVKESAQDAPPQEIRVVLNWSAEVKQILESKKN